MNIIFPYDVQKYRSRNLKKEFAPVHFDKVEEIIKMTLADKINAITQSQAAVDAAEKSLVTSQNPGDEILNEGEGIAVIPMKVVYINSGGILKIITLRSYILPTQM